MPNSWSNKSYIFHLKHSWLPYFPFSRKNFSERSYTLMDFGCFSSYFAAAYTPTCRMVNNIFAKLSPTGMKFGVPVKFPPLSSTNVLLVKSCQSNFEFKLCLFVPRLVLVQFFFSVAIYNIFSEVELVIWSILSQSSMSKQSLTIKLVERRSLREKQFIVLKVPNPEGFHGSVL